MESYSYTESYKPTMSLTGTLAPILGEVVRQRMGIKTEDERAMDLMLALGSQQPAKAYSYDDIEKLADKLHKEDKMSYADAIIEARAFFEQ